MNNNEFQQINWLDPWYPIPQDISSWVETELQREIIAGHPLYGLKVQAIARRSGYDDYLFFLPNNKLPLAVVHLTFQKETTVNFPHTSFYNSLDDWIENDMKVSHLEYIEDAVSEI